MPRLNTLIEVGFCTGYGDGDYRVRVFEIAKLPRERFNELKLATLAALRTAEDQWMREHIGRQQQALDAADKKP